MILPQTILIWRPTWNLKYTAQAIQNVMKLWGGSMMDGPLPRSLKIGKTSIGLIGLDSALNLFGRDLSLCSENAARKIFVDISSRNYIPAGSQSVYFQAIVKEVGRLRGDQRKVEWRLGHPHSGPWLRVLQQLAEASHRDHEQHGYSC